jgi:cytoskeletal protein CcmA (bactofilin family)
MFGSKTRKASVRNYIEQGNTVTAVGQKLDDLEKTLASEQAASAGVDEETTALPNVIGKGTIIEGNVQAAGDLTIEGVVKGDVTTKTKLIVGADALIEGNILSQHAEIAGRVQGTVKAMGLLVINSKGTIIGDVITKDLNVESGSTFNGRLQVGGNVTTTPIEISQVTVKPVVPVAKPVPASTSSLFTESVFDAPTATKTAVVVSEKTPPITKSDADKTAEQLAANLAKSALLH